MDDLRLESCLRTARATCADQLWYGGATTAGALRGVRHEQALWTPPGLKNSIWCPVLRMVYWEYVVRRTLSGVEERGGFACPGSDFPPLPDDPNEKAWKADVALIVEERARLVQALEDFDPARIIEQVKPLKELLEARQKLTDLKTKVDLADNLEDRLQDRLGTKVRIDHRGKGGRITIRYASSDDLERIYRHLFEPGS